jgi:hypothetical protein
MSIPEALEKVDALGDNKWTAIYIALLAVLLAICSIGDDEVSQTVTRSSIEASNTYAFFQAKNIRQTSYELAADDFEYALLNPALDENSRKFLQEKSQKYRATAERYESEPAKGEGKKELLAKARAYETERELALTRDPYFDYAQGLLQIAIVLASSSLILGGSFLLWTSGLLGLVGALCMVNAYTLVVAVPFLQ